MEPNEQIISALGSTIHYWTYNPGQPRTLIMIHGFTGDHHGFRKIIPLLTGYTVIVPDLPGSGKSTITRADWSIPGIARLTNEFVKALALAEPPVVFGHSMGTLVVASMTEQAPELYAQQLILLSPIPCRIRLFDQRWLAAKLDSLRYKIGYTVPVLGPRLVKSKLITKFVANLLITTRDPAIIRFTYDQMLENLTRISSIELYYRLQRDIQGRGVIDYATALAKKTVLIINGNIDRISPLHKVKALAQATNAQLHIIPGIGHDAHYEKASEVAVLITTFYN